MAEFDPTKYGAVKIEPSQIPILRPQLEDLTSNLSSQGKENITGKIIREIPPIGGALLGELVGGPPGAAVGAGAGETLSQFAEKLAGVRKEFDPEAIGLSAGTAALAGPLEKGISKVLSSGGRIVGAFSRGAKSLIPDVTESTARTISKYAPEVEGLAKQKSLTVNPIIEKVDQARKIIENKAGSEFKAAKEAFEASGNKFEYNQTKAIRNTKDLITSDFKGTEIVKDKIVGGPFSKKEARILEDTLEEIKNSPIKSYDDLKNLKSRIRAEASDKGLFAPIGEKSGIGERAFNKIYKSLDEYVPEGIKEANKLYSQRLNLIEQIQDRLVKELEGGDISPSSINKIKNLSKEEFSGTYSNLLEGIKKETGLDLKKEVDIFSAAKEINPNLVKPGTNILGIFNRTLRPVAGQLRMEATKTGPVIESIANLTSKAVAQTGKILRRSAAPTGKIGLLELLRQSISGAETRK